MIRNFLTLLVIIFLVLIPVSGENTEVDIDDGDLLYEEGQYREALAVYDKAIQLDDTDPVLYEKKAECLSKLNRYKEALVAINMAISLDGYSESMKKLKDKIAQKLEPEQGSQVPDSIEHDNRINYAEELLEPTKDETSEGREKVSLEASEDTIVRGTPFSINITGNPNAEYYLWTKETGTMTGLPDDQPPMILQGQPNVRQDLIEGPYEIGQYLCQECKERNIKRDVPDDPDYHGTAFYGLVKLDDSGSSIVEWETSKDTKATTYSIHIERKSGNQYESDDLQIQINKGKITVIDCKTGDCITYHENDSDQVTSTGKGLPPPTSGLD